jgi:hypothetical protein
MFEGRRRNQRVDVAYQAGAVRRTLSSPELAVAVEDRVSGEDWGDLPQQGPQRAVVIQKVRLTPNILGDLSIDQSAGHSFVSNKPRSGKRHGDC